MPVVLTYPGVYIEEIPSGQFTITGVATSITAFIGRAVCGPTDLPVTLFNFGDYERMFGGLSYDFPLSYAVQDFFMNGGGQAVVARLYEPTYSQDDWSAAAAAAKTAMSGALAPLLATPIAAPTDAPAAGTTDAPTAAPATAPFDPAKILAAGKAAAAALTGAAQSIANDLLQAVTRTATAPGATLSNVNATLTTWTAPAWSSGTATLNVDSVASGAAAAPAQAVALAAFDAAFKDGAADASATVAAIRTAAGNAVAYFSDSAQRKIARDVANTAAPAATLAAAGGTGTTAAASGVPPQAAAMVAAHFTAVTSAIKAASPAIAPAIAATFANLQTHMTAAVNDLLTAAGPLTATSASGSISKVFGTASGTPDAAVSAAAAAAVVGAASALDVLAAATAAISTAAFAVPAETQLQLVAANPGSWSQGLQVSIDTQNINAHTAKGFAAAGLAMADLFNLNVVYTRPNGTVDIERFTNVTVMNPHPNRPVANRLDLVLAQGSRYVRVKTAADGSPILPSQTPPVATGKAANGDDGAYLQSMTYIGDESQKTGIYMLKHVDLFNLLCIPPDNRSAGRDTDSAVYQEAMAFCNDRRAMLIVDPPSSWSASYKSGNVDTLTPESLYLFGTQTRNATVYFPRVIKEDVMMGGQRDVFPACGAVAGVIAATDVRRGVWKAPAGQNAGLNNIHGLEVTMTDDEQGLLNPLGINCLRNLPVLGPVVWGARTLRGADQLEDDFKYLSVRRLALFIEESLYRGTRWAVYEPNNEALWSSLRLSIGAFMGDLAKQGAFYGFKVKCDADTNTQTNIDKGIVTVLVQYAPVKPAEFVVLQFQQQAGISPS